MPEKIPVSILTDGIKDLKLLKDWGDYLAKDDGFGRDKVGKLSTSQIRKFFGSIKRIQADFEKAKGEILLLEPKLAYAKQGWDEYIGRLKHYHTMRITHIPDKHNTATHIAAAAGQAYTVALVIDGPQLTSPQLANRIEAWNQAGREVAFLIGGPDGLPPEVIAASDLQLSMSKLTFPHDLAMVVLAETLYRASTIAAGQPYHR